MATTRRSRVAAESIGTSTSARDSSVSNRFGGCLPIPGLPIKAILIETEKAGSAERAGTLVVDPYDKKNLGYVAATTKAATAQRRGRLTSIAPRLRP